MKYSLLGFCGAALMSGVAVDMGFPGTGCALAWVAFVTLLFGPKALKE